MPHSKDPVRLDDSIELGQLVREFMLNEGEKPSWFMRADAGDHVRWVTDGIANPEGGPGPHRLGTAHVKVDGTLMKVLRQTVEEVHWEVRLEGKEPAKFGPKSVTIDPTNDSFGTTGSGCDFEIGRTIEAAGIEIVSLCKDFERGGGIEVFLAESEGKQPALLQYWTSAGSGGTTNWVTIYWDLENTDDEARPCPLKSAKSAEHSA